MQMFGVSNCVQRPNSRLLHLVNSREHLDACARNLKLVDYTLKIEKYNLIIFLKLNMRLG